MARTLLPSGFAYPSAVTFCVELTGVHKTFGATRALDGLSLTAEQGRVTAVLGPNGAGKSTAMAICEGLQQADTGTTSDGSAA